MTQYELSDTVTAQRAEQLGRRDPLAAIDQEAAALSALFERAVNNDQINLSLEVSKQLTRLRESRHKMSLELGRTLGLTEIDCLVRRICETILTHLSALPDHEEIIDTLIPAILAAVADEPAPTIPLRRDIA